MNYYEILGIPNDHPQKNIPQVFRNKAKMIHPDKCRDQHEIEQYKDATILLIEAYRTLNNPQLRHQYDERLKSTAFKQEVQNTRYFEQTNIIEKDGTWHVLCEQCSGQSMISPSDLIKIYQSSSCEFFMQCFYCGMSLSLQKEQR